MTEEINPNQEQLVNDRKEAARSLARIRWDNEKPDKAFYKRISKLGVAARKKKKRRKKKKSKK